MDSGSVGILSKNGGGDCPLAYLLKLLERDPSAIRTPVSPVATTEPVHPSQQQGQLLRRRLRRLAHALSPQHLVLTQPCVCSGSCVCQDMLLAGSARIRILGPHYG